MKSEITKIELVEQPDPASLPNGEYQGTWGGYEVDTKINGHTYRLHTERGIRTFAARCRVIIKDGQITVETR